MASASPVTFGLIIFSAILQIAGFAMMPASKGGTAPVPTIIMIILFNTALFVMARVTHSGVNLGLLMPLLTILVPMGGVAVGAFFYGESASAMKVALLFAACALVVVANTR